MLGGEPDRGLELLDDARDQFESMRNADDVSEVDVLLAECHLARRRPGARARDRRGDQRGEPDPARRRSSGPGAGPSQALGDVDGAREALEVSLADARDQDALYEIARTLDALVALDVRHGDLASAEAREIGEHRPAPPGSGVRIDPERRISLIDARDRDRPATHARAPD